MMGLLLLRICRQASFDLGFSNRHTLREIHRRADTLLGPRDVSKHFRSCLTAGMKRAVD